MHDVEILELRDAMNGSAALFSVVIESIHGIVEARIHEGAVYEQI